MSKNNWQLQLRKAKHADTKDSTYHWLDIVTVSNSGKYGPGSKVEAKAHLDELRGIYPDEVYRIVKVSQL